jgi:hypothetical protein
MNRTVSGLFPLINMRIKKALNFSTVDRLDAPGTRDVSLHQSIDISTEAHPASYSMGTRGSFPRSKAPKA